MLFRSDLPKLETYVTLSPVPGFMKWLKTQQLAAGSEEKAVADKIVDPVWAADDKQAETLRKPVEALAAEYFLAARTPNGRPVDAVARFHLGNGARLERINFLGDRSVKALKDGAGLMVNYLYDLDDIEKNHEAYANQRIVAASSAVKRLARNGAKGRLQVPAASAS